MNHREPEQQVDCARGADTLWREPHTEGRLTGNLSFDLRMHHITGGDSVVSVTWLLML